MSTRSKSTSAAPPLTPSMGALRGGEGGSGGGTLPPGAGSGYMNGNGPPQQQQQLPDGRKLSLRSPPGDQATGPRGPGPPGGGGPGQPDVPPRGPPRRRPPSRDMTAGDGGGMSLPIRRRDEADGGGGNPRGPGPNRQSNKDCFIIPQGNLERFLPDGITVGSPLYSASFICISYDSSLLQELILELA